jgi:hypothetical protein
MLYRSLPATATAVLCSLFLFVGSASGQSGRATEHNSARRREVCVRNRDIVAKARSGSYDSTTLNAIATLGSCSRSAGTVIPRLWNLDVTDSRGLAALVSGSRGVRDGRIFAAAARVAEDQARPRPMRQAALIVIASYVKSDIGATFGEYRFPGAPNELAVYSARLSHGAQDEGDQPVPADVRPRVEAILKGIVSTKRGALEDLARWLLIELSI